MEAGKQTFPFKLYHTIEWASDSEFSSALSWSPTGNAFVVHNREDVVEHIIPKFFDHKRWRSFVSRIYDMIRRNLCYYHYYCLLFRVCAIRPVS